MRISVIAALAVLVLLSGAVPGRAQKTPAVPVVASILPVHSLVSGVMAGVGKPNLLVPGGASPHSFALRPSDARRLEAAKAVFWVGPAIETFLVRPLNALARHAVVVALVDADGVVHLSFREGGPWAEHDHDHGHEHDHADRADHGDDQDHADHAIDAHMWLDPQNAIAFVGAIAEALAQADPANASVYATNARSLVGKLRALDEELRQALAPARNKPYIVFHDAYQYFEARYDLHPAGSITVSPELSPGARRLVEIRNRIKSDKAVCVFAEPQFEPKLIRTAIEGTDARAATLDPLGARLKPGPNAYFQLLRNLARDLTDCLEGRS
jgi:zinc transport system substrate-binding protein